MTLKNYRRNRLSKIEDLRKKANKNEERKLEKSMMIEKTIEYVLKSGVQRTWVFFIKFYLIKNRIDELFEEGFSSKANFIMSRFCCVRIQRWWKKKIMWRQCFGMNR